MDSAFFNKQPPISAHDPEFPKTLSVITGKGLHSSGGVPRLKLGIKALLNTQAIPLVTSFILFYGLNFPNFQIRILEFFILFLAIMFSFKKTFLGCS